MLNLPKFEEVTAFRATLTPESDRGCALIAAAYIDSQLKEMIESQFIDDKKCVDELLGQSGVLGSFSSRINICYAIGLLPVKVYRSLHLIRKIRNDFGHVPDPIDFTDPAISSRCGELDQGWNGEGAEPRDLFCTAVMDVLAWIHAKLQQAKKPEVPTRTNVDVQTAKAEFETIFDQVLDKILEGESAELDREEFIRLVRESVTREYSLRYSADNQDPV